MERTEKAAEGHVDLHAGFDALSVLKGFVGGIPVIGGLMRTAYARFQCFSGVHSYWESRYAAGGHSGVGSYGKFATFKAEVINDFVRKHRISSVIEYGCGDGNQLALLEIPDYLGFDVSATALSLCREKFAGDTTKKFRLSAEYSNETADLTLSLDVIYHLVEDEIFEEYMQRLFGSSEQFVIIYSDNGEYQARAGMPHVRHRQFTAWVENNARDWQLLEKIPNRYPYSGNNAKGSFADFYIYRKHG